MPPKKHPEKSEAKSTEKSNGVSIERSLKRLEEIVGELEEGGIPLERALEMYEEGVGISKDCLDRLQKAELRLKVLMKDAEGNIELTDEDEQEKDDE
ncbi:MAG TPA: exodeoxyribonuclease VII small subunit [Bacteroidota bacterium]|nr:exodeoxyribonuclease VII small subunit [Bacteroidota bacterium]